MNNAPDNKSKWMKICMAVACIFVVIAILKMAGCSIFNSESKNVQLSMATYLKDRYGREFDVGEPYLTGEGSASHYQAKARPKGEPEPMFLVNGDNYSVRLNGKYTDFYLREKWDYQGRMEIEKKLKEIYGEEVQFTVRYSFGGLGYTLKDLDYAKVFEATKNRNNNIRSSLSYDIFMDGAQFNKEEEAEKAYELLKPFIFDFSNNYNVSVLYIDKADKEDYLKNTKLYTDKAIHQIYPANNDKKIIDYFSLKSSKEKSYTINSGSDIIKFSEQ